MSLSKFLENDTQTMQNKKIVFLDLYNMVFRYIHIAHKSNPLDEEFKDWRYMMTWGIMNIAKDFKPDQFIIAVDEGSSWRKEVYPDYKGQRKDNRKESAIDFEKFFPVMEEYISILKELLTNVYILRSPTIEADDFIAVLTKRFGNTNEIVNISTDKDFYQLYKYRGYKQYNPIQKKFVQVLKPDLELHVKLLTGDSSDDSEVILDKDDPKFNLTAYNKFMDNKFTCRPRGSYEERHKDWLDYVSHSNNYIDKMYTVRYQEKYNNGKPRFPAGISIRWDL